jgi:hypothetical protein
VEWTYSFLYKRGKVVVQVLADEPYSTEKEAMRAVEGLFDEKCQLLDAVFRKALREKMQDITFLEQRLASNGSEQPPNLNE